MLLYEVLQRFLEYSRLRLELHGLRTRGSEELDIGQTLLQGQRQTSAGVWQNHTERSPPPAPPPVDPSRVVTPGSGVRPAGRFCGC